MLLPHKVRVTEGSVRATGRDICGGGVKGAERASNANEVLCP